MQKPTPSPMPTPTLMPFRPMGEVRSGLEVASAGNVGDMKGKTSDEAPELNDMQWCALSLEIQGTARPNGRFRRCLRILPEVRLPTWKNRDVPHGKRCILLL